MSIMTYTALVPRQSSTHKVFTFCAKASEIFSFAVIDRITRSADGGITGFQRPQVASHIKEIREYLSRNDAVLPNSVVVAFTSGVVVSELSDGLAKITINTDNENFGYIVDGQQRLSALSGLQDKDFQVIITGLLCSNDEELRKQFILINNTKPLPKSLIYELLPTVKDLPDRLSSRSIAATLVERLNYDEGSSLHNLIKMHTNPAGIIQDTVIQRFIMLSLADGIMRELSVGDNGLDRCYSITNSFFKAVSKTFSDEWHGKTPKTSRLVHSAGIIAMGYVMEHLHCTTGATRSSEFAEGLKPLKGKTAWTQGYWEFGPDSRRPWNAIQFVPRDYQELAHFLVRAIKNS